MQDGVASQNGVADLEKDEERMVKNLVKAAKEPSLGFASHSQHLSHKNEHLVMMMMMMMMTMLLLLMMMTMMMIMIMMMMMMMMMMTGTS